MNGISYINIENNVPVELISFNASQSGYSINLKWNTATETNNLGFEIERQIIKEEIVEPWRLIGFEKGEGTSTVYQNYFYEDKNSDLLASSIRYRLKQIDFDGSFKYSSIIEVNNIIPLSFSLDQNYPNPFNPTTTINFGIPQSNFVNLAIYNIVGEEIVSLVNKEMDAGYYTVNWDAYDVPSGVYLYKITAGDFVKIKKMILLK